MVPPMYHCQASSNMTITASPIPMCHLNRQSIVRGEGTIVEQLWSA
jgi:hypothetical protein